MTALEIKKRYIFVLFLLSALAVFLVPQFAHAVDDEVTVTAEVGVCSDCEDAAGGESGSTPTTGDAGSGSFVFQNVSITQAFESIVIRWKTPVPTKSTVKWGKDASYDLGLINEGNFSTDHVVVIEGLTLSTEYYVRIDAVSDDGATAFWAQKTATLSPQDVVIPPSVANVRAFHNDGRVEIRWENPRYELFDYVRIMRNTRISLSPQDGRKVFEDDGEIFVDDSVEADETYYYTLFVRDSLGNFSAAALVISTPAQRQQAGAFDESPDGRDVVPLSILNLTLLDIRFLQGNERLDPNKNVVHIDAKQNVTLSIPAPIFPSFHSHVLLSVSSPGNPENTFLYVMNYNEKNDAYEVTLQPFFDKGTSEFTLSFLDTNDRLYRKLEGRFIIDRSQQDRFAKIGSVLTDAAGAGGDTILSGIETFGSLLINSVRYYHEAGLLLAEGLATLVTSMLMGAFQFVMILLNGFVELILATTQMTRALAGIFSDTLTLAGVTTLGLYASMTDLFSETVRLAYGIGDGVLTALGSVGFGIRVALGTVSDTFGAVGSGIAYGVDSVISGVLAVGHGIIVAFETVGTAVATVGSVIGAGLAALGGYASRGLATLGTVGELGLSFGHALTFGIDSVTDVVSRGIVSVGTGLALFGDGLISVSFALARGYADTIGYLGQAAFYAGEFAKAGYLSVGQGVLAAFDTVTSGYSAGVNAFAASYESIGDLLEEIIDEIVETFKRFG